VKGAGSLRFGAQAPLPAGEKESRADLLKSPIIETDVTLTSAGSIREPNLGNLSHKPGDIPAYPLRGSLSNSQISLSQMFIRQELF
jgi:hypothetical protein